MFTNPGITADLAAQHRRELTAQARACRPARSTVPPATRPIARRVVASLAAAVAAAAVLMTSPAGDAHLASHFGAPHVYAVHFGAPHLYAAHFYTGVNHYRSGVGHHF